MARFAIVIVDRRADEDDVVLQQPGEDVVRPLAPVGLLDHHRDQLRARVAGSVLAFMIAVPLYAVVMLAFASSKSIVFSRRMPPRSRASAAVLLQLRPHGRHRAAAALGEPRRSPVERPRRSPPSGSRRAISSSTSVAFTASTAGVALGRPELVPVDAGLPRIDLLLDQPPRELLDPAVQLVLHQHARAPRTAPACASCASRSRAHLAVGLVRRLVLEVLPHARAQRRQRVEVAEVLRELVVQRRHDALLDGLQRHRVLAPRRPPSPARRSRPGSDRERRRRARPRARPGARRTPAGSPRAQLDRHVLVRLGRRRASRAVSTCASRSTVRPVVAASGRPSTGSKRAARWRSRSSVAVHGRLLDRHRRLAQRDAAVVARIERRAPSRTWR